jgi:hypothetical protein
MPITELMRPPTDGKTHGIPLFLGDDGKALSWGGWESLEGFSAKGIRLRGPREVPLL